MASTTSEEECLVLIMGSDVSCFWCLLIVRKRQLVLVCVVTPDVLSSGLVVKQFFAG